MNIAVGLSTDDMKRLQAFIKTKAVEVTDVEKRLVQSLCAEGKKHAIQEVDIGAGTGDPIIDTGLLRSGITYSVRKNKYTVTGEIRSSAVNERGTNYTSFVEYGWGLTGAGSPHPKPGAFGMASYIYNGTGKNLKGFFSRPYMYNTAQFVRNQIHKVAKATLSTW